MNPSQRFCYKCGGQISNDAKFCGNCGVKLNKTKISSSSYNNSDANRRLGYKAIGIFILFIVSIFGIRSLCLYSGITLKSYDGKRSLRYSCMGFSHKAKTSEDIQIIAKAFSLAIVHARRNNNAVMARKLIAIRKGNDWQKIEKAVVEYLCKNKDALD